MNGRFRGIWEEFVVTQATLRSWTELAHVIRCITAEPNNFSNVAYLEGMELCDKLIITGLETVLKICK
jgi:hypothetical protein